jgi:oleate hydratase
MSAAAFMIRDGDMLGSDVRILEEFDAIGGKLDGSPSARPATFCGAVA